MIVFIKSTVEDRIDKVFPAFNPTSQHLLIHPILLSLNLAANCEGAYVLRMY